MTNVSIKNTFVALSVLIAAAALSLGAFAVTVHAQEFGDGGYFAGDAGFGGGDGYFAGDDSGYFAGDNGYFGDDSGYFYGDQLGLDGCGSDCGGYFAGDDGYFYGDQLGLEGCGSCGSPEYSYSDYGYETYGQSYSQPYQQAMSFVPPSVRQYVPSQPIYSQPVRSTPVQQQQQQQGGSTPININNVNTNVNTNTNVAPVTPAQPQPIVQYVQQPVYYPTYQPTYYQPNYYQQAPFCTITATTGYNGLVTLSWSSTNATSAYISPSVGAVAPYGTTNLYAYGTRIYTMTVSGPGGTQTCTTQALLAPTTPYVSLSQIPYTGFDLGPIGNAIYWAALLSFAVAGAYLLVYFRGGAMALVSSTISRKTPLAQTVAQAPLQASTPVVSPVQKASLASLPTMSENTTRDSMQIARAADGMPRIVIARA